MVTPERRYGNAVTTAFLRRIERLVGTSNEGLRIFARHHFGHTKGASHLLLRDKRRRFNRLAELFSKERRILDTRLVAQDHELFAAPAHKGIRIANHALHKLCKVHKDFVANEMAVCIVHILEVVDVENHERHREAGPVELFLFAEENTAKASTVEAPGKRVFLTGLLVLALFDFESAEVLLEFLLLLLFNRAFTTVIEEPDNQDDKEGDKP